MCGIAGIIAKKDAKLPIRETIESYTRTLQHRGPDDFGYHLNEYVGFLNRRLSIVDIAGGKQPIFSEDKKIGIVYNGEVYNYLELRKELEGRGHHFKTNSDTEVILKMYEQCGEKSFARLNGMFGICIWDERNGEIFLVRDHIGIKPLYVYEDDDKFLFSSELKGILALPGIDRALDPAGIQDYLMFRYTQAPFTIFRRIRRLDAGTYLRIKHGIATQFRYWEPEYHEPLKAPSENDARAELLSLMEKAVSSQLMGEVPIGVLLSGGVDSSAIAYFVHKLGADLTTFNIGFPEVNEFEFSRAVAKHYGLKHREITVTVDELLARLDKIVPALDEPLADAACFPLYRLCEELKKEVTVVLSGEGGDELFAGYPQYAQVLNERAQHPDLFHTFLERSWYFNDYRRFFNDQHLPPHVLRNRKYFEELPLLNSMLSFDMKTWMPDNLMMKADKILMAHSLEGRFPFLDRGLFDFAARLPQQYKLHPGGMQKWILKQAVADKLPPLIIERPKMGFSVPVDVFLKKLESQVRESIRSCSSGELASVLNFPEIQNVVENYYAKGQGVALQVWVLFILCRWYESQAK